ncbi:MAG: hypothetical protein Q8864_02490, partial [Sweet potato little leaf phytoplasma]|nr:hypothetical protein [Sweet potato little leaf phytoplasma]
MLARITIIFAASVVLPGKIFLLSSYGNPWFPSHSIFHVGGMLGENVDLRQAENKKSDFGERLLLLSEGRGILQPPFITVSYNIQLVVYDL